MKKLTIFDFDGTIVDVWPRYYKVFKDYWRAENLTLKSYRNYKLQFKDDDEIIKRLGFDARRIPEYKSYKKENLEEPKYLKLDKLLVEKEVLFNYFDNNNTLVLTVRRNQDELITQMKNLDLEFLIEKTIVLFPGGKEKKVNWFEENFRYEGIDLFVVGDSETDMAFSRIKNSKVYFVKTGLRSYEHMKEICPEFHVLENIHKFLELINNAVS